MTNDWLGLTTYLVSGRTDHQSKLITTALEVAIKLGKLQFPNTLLSRQTEETRVRGREVGENGQTLLCC